MSPARDENVSGTAMEVISLVDFIHELDTLRINVYTRFDSLLKGYGRVAQEIIFISVAARRLGMHPQTLRKYERIGLVRPSRTVGSMRVYSRAEISRLRMIKHLVDDLGVNLAGVQLLMSVADGIERIRPLMNDIELDRPTRRRQLARELDRIRRLLGL